MEIREKRTYDKNEEKSVLLRHCTLHFNLRSPKSSKPTPLYAILLIRYNDNIKVQYKLSLNVSILPSNWDKVRETILLNGTEGEHVLSQLIRVLTLVNKLKLFFLNFIYMFALDEISGTKLIEEIKNIINCSKTNIMNEINLKNNRGITASKVVKSAFNEKYSENSGKTKSTITQQRYKLKSFLKYLNEGGVTDSAKNRLTVEGLNSYRKYLHKKNPTLSQLQSYKLVAFIASLTNYAIANREKNIGINQIILDGFVKTQIKRDAKLDNVHVEILEEELDKLLNVSLETKYLRDIRDLFLFDCAIGCRFSDLQKILSKDFEIKVIDGQNVLVYSTKKGENKHINAIIPFEVNPLIQTTIDRIVNDEFTVKPNNSTFNKAIKKIFKEANINRKIDYKDANGVKHSEELYNVVTWHCCRVTGATQLLRKHADPEFVVKALGWVDDAMLKEVYARLTPDDEAKQQSKRVHKNTMSKTATKVYDEVADLKNALGYLGATYGDISDTTSISDLYVKIREYEGILLEKGVDYRVVKEIYNENISMTERIEKLKIACAEALKTVR